MEIPSKKVIIFILFNAVYQWLINAGFTSACHCEGSLAQVIASKFIVRPNPMFSNFG
jgi:hypothetical protein